MMRRLRGVVMGLLCCVAAGGAWAQDAEEQGVFVYMGYSSDPARDAAQGFTMAGPVYGRGIERQLAWLDRCATAGLTTPCTVGLDMGFNRPADERPRYTEAEIEALIAEQVEAYVEHPAVGWWYITPEEIRYWRAEELAYLATVTRVIRELDTLGRPVWMYEPNHRDGEALTRTGEHLDVIGKGSYVGPDDERRGHPVWVRSGVRQQVRAAAALEAADGRARRVLVMPGLFADPADAAQDHLIPTWVRHDVYAGLIEGARGVAVWSFFKRREVRRTWELWYDAHARVARELCGPSGDDGLGRVFLRGEVCEVVGLRQAAGPATVTDAQLAAAERTSYEHTLPTLGVAEFAYGGEWYVFAVNSHGGEAVTVETNALPEGTAVTELNAPERVTLNDQRVLRARLAPLQVRVFRFTPASE